MLFQQRGSAQPQEGHPGCLRKPFVPGSDGLGFRDLRDALRKTNVKFAFLWSEHTVTKAGFAKPHIKMKLIGGDGGRQNQGS